MTNWAGQSNIGDYMHLKIKSYKTNLTIKIEF